MAACSRGNSASTVSSGSVNTRFRLNSGSRNSLETRRHRKRSVSHSASVGYGGAFMPDRIGQPLRHGQHSGTPSIERLNIGHPCFDLRLDLLRRHRLLLLRRQGRKGWHRRANRPFKRGRGHQAVRDRWGPEQRTTVTAGEQDPTIAPPIITSPPTQAGFPFSRVV
jgi:hypothetical protein